MAWFTKVIPVLAKNGPSLWLVRGLMFAIGLAVSYVMLPVQTAAYARITSVDTGHATAIFTAAQRSAELLDRDPESIRVIAPDVGGGFGPKAVFYAEEAVIAAAAL